MNKTLMTALAAAFLATASALAATTTWTGKGADRLWNNPDNWSNGAPSGAQNEGAIFESDATVEVDGAQHYYALRIRGESSSRGAVP